MEFSRGLLILFVAFALCTGFVWSQTEATASAPVTATPSAVTTQSTPVAETATNSVATATTNAPVQLTPEQQEKIRRMLKQQQLDAEQRKRAAELLNRTPVLEDKVNPGITEKESIPKRF